MPPRVPVPFEDLPIAVVGRGDFAEIPGIGGADEMPAHLVDEEIDRIGNEFKAKALDIYENAEEMNRHILALANVFEEGLPAIETLALTVRVFYEHPILIFHLNQFFRFMGGIQVWFEEIGDGEFRYVIRPENIVVPIPTNPDGTNRRIVAAEMAQFQ